MAEGNEEDVVNNMPQIRVFSDPQHGIGIEHNVSLVVALGMLEIAKNSLHEANKRSNALKGKPAIVPASEGVLRDLDRAH